MEPLVVKERNRNFYNGLWKRSRLYSDTSFNTWPLLEDHVAHCEDRLEIGPGLKPRLPILGTNFLDLSEIAVDKLNAAGGEAMLGSIDELPYADNSFDLLCAFDVIEHVVDDTTAFAEIERVLRPGGTFFLSVPLRQDAWTHFDHTVGHARRYERDEIAEQLNSFGFKPKHSASYGMMPKQKWLTSFGMACMLNMPGFAMKFYNALFFPIILRKQKTLELHDGIIDDPLVVELIIECTKENTNECATE